MKCEISGRRVAKNGLKDVHGKKAFEFALVCHVRPQRLLQITNVVFIATRSGLRTNPLLTISAWPINVLPGIAALSLIDLVRHFASSCFFNLGREHFSIVDLQSERGIGSNAYFVSSDAR